MSAVIEQTIETYGIENWGAGYFGVNRKGNLIVRASENDNLSADVKEIIEDLKKRGINPPVLLRFPQLLVGQVRKLQRPFVTPSKNLNTTVTYVRLSDEGQSKPRRRRRISARRIAL